jgi:hypothetical protein
MKAQVLKQMTSQGVVLNVGDIVDVSTWRHAKTLQSSRYIKIVDVEPTPVAKPVAKKVEEVKVEEPKAEVPVVEEKPKAKKDKVAE